MADQARISATISTATKAELDRFTEGRGLKRDFVVEQALLVYLQARRELPDEALLPSRILLGDESFDRVATILLERPAPTDALRRLMRAEGD